MDYIPSFIRRKSGQEEIKYDIPCMEKYLKDTYAITVYQEQVMRLSRQLANATRGESDALRKAMGKKKKEIVDSMKGKFLAGGVANGHDPKVLDKIWTDWEKFASYAFNKSHATCYSWVSYQTAYLKAHYPAEFMAGNMSRCLNDIGKITKLMSECKAMGVKCLGPDVNESWQKFAANKNGEIRFGLAAVKGMGEAAAQAIIDERQKNGPYKSVFDFAERVSLSAVNRKAFESLALCGGFDSFGIKREQYFGANSKGDVFLDSLVRYGQLYQAEKAEASNSLFGDSEAVEIATPPVPDAEPWSTLERLNRERDLVGIYISGHPLDDYSVVLKNLCNTHCSELDDKKELLKKNRVTVGGIVTGVRTGMTKKNKPYGIVKMEDYDGDGELALFGDDWGKYSGWFQVGSSLYMAISYSQKFQGSDFVDMRIESVSYLQTVKEKSIDRITINVDPTMVTDITVEELSTIVKDNPGNTQVYFNILQPGSSETVMMRSTIGGVNLVSELTDFIESDSALSFTVN